MERVIEQRQDAVGRVIGSIQGLEQQERRHKDYTESKIMETACLATSSQSLNRYFGNESWRVEREDELSDGPPLKRLGPFSARHVKLLPFSGFNDCHSGLQ